MRSRRTPAGPRTLTGSKAQTRPTWSGWGLAPVKGRPGQAPAVGDLADYLLLRHHSAVELIGRAEAGRLVERWRDDSNGRVIRVRLTGDGERRLSQLAPAHLVILTGSTISGTGGRDTRADQTQRGAGEPVTASNHILREAGPAARRRRPCPVSAPAREGRGSADAPVRDLAPAHSPAEDQVVMLSPGHAFLSGISRLIFRSRHGLGPRLAGAAGERPRSPQRKLSQYRDGGQART